MSLKSKKLFKQVGQECGGISGKEARRQIEFMINDILDHADEDLLDKWSRIPAKGDRPTPEEAIAYFASIIREQNKQNDKQ